MASVDINGTSFEYVESGYGCLACAVRLGRSLALPRLHPVRKIVRHYTGNVRSPGGLWCR